MNEKAIIEYITGTFEGVYTLTNADNIFFMYDPDGMFPFATLMTNDENDQFSDLNRPGVYRLNIGLSKATFRAMFGSQTSPDGADDNNYDFTAPDKVMPHPVYGKMYWVCILNPSAATFESVVKPLLVEAYEQDVSKHTKRANRK